LGNEGQRLPLQHIDHLIVPPEEAWKVAGGDRSVLRHDLVVGQDPVEDAGGDLVPPIAAQDLAHHQIAVASFDHPVLRSLPGPDLDLGRQRVEPRRQEGELAQEEHAVVGFHLSGEPADRLLAGVHEGELEGVVFVERRDEEEHGQRGGGEVDPERAGDRFAQSGVEQGHGGAGQRHERQQVAERPELVGSHQQAGGDAEEEPAGARPPPAAIRQAHGELGHGQQEEDDPELGVGGREVPFRPVDRLVPVGAGLLGAVDVIHCPQAVEHVLRA